MFDFQKILYIMINILEFSYTERFLKDICYTSDENRNLFNFVSSPKFNNLSHMANLQRIEGDLLILKLPHFKILDNETSNETGHQSYMYYLNNDNQLKLSAIYEAFNASYFLDIYVVDTTLNKICGVPKSTNELLYGRVSPAEHCFDMRQYTSPFAEPDFTKLRIYQPWKDQLIFYEYHKDYIIETLITFRNIYTLTRIEVSYTPNRPPLRYNLDLKIVVGQCPLSATSFI